MTTANVTSLTRAYIIENFLYTRRDVRLNDSDSLLGQGIIDSMGVVELVQFLERQFNIEVGDEDITEENLGTLEAIGRYVASKLPSQVAAA